MACVCTALLHKKYGSREEVRQEVIGLARQLGLGRLLHRHTGIDPCSAETLTLLDPLKNE